MNTKDKIREKVWRTLEKEKVALFPGARGRIPNFTEDKISVIPILRELLTSGLK